MVLSRRGQLVIGVMATVTPTIWRGGGGRWPLTDNMADGK